MCVLLTACGDRATREALVEPIPAPTAATQGDIVGPLSTGSISEPVFVYYDLDNKAVIELTAEQALTNTDWDIAFKRS